MNELGTLFSTLAGMLNIIVILDAALPTRRSPHPSPGTQAPGSSAVAPRPEEDAPPSGSPGQKEEATP